MDKITMANALKAVFGTSITPTSSQCVPITAADGTPAGISSMANLASVLGAAAWIQGTNITPNGTITIEANAYRPVIVREVSVEGVSAILLGEYSGNSFTAYKSPKFDQVLSVSMDVGGAYTITNITNKALTLFYDVI